MKSERLGMVMIPTTLAVIAVIAALLFERQVAARRVAIRDEGVGLVRLLSRLPYDQLVANRAGSGLLHAVPQSRNSPELGYGVIVDTQGALLAEVTSAGTLVPAAPAAGEAFTRVGERTLSSPGDERRITEFFGPLVADGKPAGLVRVGFFEPERNPFRTEQVSFLAVLALAVFLPVPLFYFVLKREMRPLRDLTPQLNRLADSSGAPLAKLGMSDDLREFVHRFGQLLEAAQTRMQTLEADRFTATLNSRVLSYRQEKIDSVLQALPEAILVIDEEGTISYANAKLDPILGVDHTTLAGRNLAEAALAPEIAAFLARCRSHPAQTFRGDSIEISPAATPERKVAVGAYPLFSPRTPGDMLGLLVAFRDVTQEFLARRAGAEFVAHVSHELKSPLNVLTMYSELLLDPAGNSEQERIEAINVVRDEVERMAGLINNLLNISRLETGNVSLDRQRVKLRDLLQDVFDEVAKNAHGKDLRLECDLPPELAPVLLDKDLFRIAICNILSNAIKYNRPGGTVLLAADETDTQVRIRVRDSGIGIAPEDQGKVFDKFFRSANAAASGSSGHGLGLYLAREIAELHHGRITVASEPGRGTEFCVQLTKTPALLQEAVRL
ncbi:MAG TPA: ATP-binding protein [Burkholderiales bacterium]|nr:ATP-binding protein [Burkholderiales bacterium]